MTCLLLTLSSSAIVAVVAATAGYRMRNGRCGERTPEGFAGSDDFSWPGRPMRIIDAETAARHVGGGE